MLAEATEKKAGEQEVQATHFDSASHAGIHAHAHESDDCSNKTRSEREINQRVVRLLRRFVALLHRMMAKMALFALVAALLVIFAAAADDVADGSFLQMPDSADIIYPMIVASGGADAEPAATDAEPAAAVTQEPDSEALLSSPSSAADAPTTVDPNAPGLKVRPPVLSLLCRPSPPP